MTLISAADLAATEMREVKHYWGDFLRTSGRLAVIGEPKTAKSFFVMEMGLHIATGTRFLGFETRAGNVLYVNLELSSEQLQERLMDMSAELGIDLPDNFLTWSPTDGVALDTQEGHQALEAVIASITESHGGLGVLIIDPRRQSMRGDENQSEVLTKWCTSLDMLRGTYGFATVIVHHTGKSTTGAGRGSSVFDGWLDTMLWLKASKSASYSTESSERLNLRNTEIFTRGRDIQEGALIGTFKYPTWELSESQLTQQKSKAEQCAAFVLEQLRDGEWHSLGALRRKAYRADHTEYALKRTMLGLRSRVQFQQDSSHQGNWKLVRLVPPETTA